MLGGFERSKVLARPTQRNTTVSAGRRPARRATAARGREVAGSERPTSVEPDDISDRMHGFGEGHHDERLLVAEIHQISMPLRRVPCGIPCRPRGIHRERTFDSSQPDWASPRRQEGD